MNCTNCCYNLPKDGHTNCTYEEGECVKITKLEKENAELKAKLSKANELLKDFLLVAKVERLKDRYETVEEAEQFLKEVENAELKRGYHYEAEVINGKPTGKAILVSNLEYAKSIVKDLLDNSDEYAKQRAREFLEKNKC